MTRREAVAGNVPRPPFWADMPVSQQLEWLRLNRTRPQLIAEIGARVGFEHDERDATISKEELMQTVLMIETLLGET